MTRARGWPNQAEWARADAIAYATDGLQALETIISGRCNDKDLYKQVAVAQSALHKIRYGLSTVGPDKNSGSSCSSS